MNKIACFYLEYKKNSLKQKNKKISIWWSNPTRAKHHSKWITNHDRSSEAKKRERLIFNIWIFNKDRWQHQFKVLNRIKRACTSTCNSVDLGPMVFALVAMILAAVSAPLLAHASTCSWSTRRLARVFARVSGAVWHRCVPKFVLSVAFK